MSLDRLVLSAQIVIAFCPRFSLYTLDHIPVFLFFLFFLPLEDSICLTIHLFKPSLHYSSKSKGVYDIPQQCKILLKDTICNPCSIYSRSRKISYPHADIFLVCF